MTEYPLVSVITPTWHRHDKLRACMDSVRQQLYRGMIEHVVVSDGPDERLSMELSTGGIRSQDGRYVRQIYDQLPEHDLQPHWGARVRSRAIELCHGELIAYLDDDDVYRSDHIEVLTRALSEHPEAGFAYSKMMIHGQEVFADPPARGHIGTPMIMHRKSLLLVGAWGSGGEAEDWDLVDSWLRAGVGYAAVDTVTVDAGRLHARSENMTWALHATGSCDAATERELAERITAVLSDPDFGTTASQLGGDAVNGPVHETHRQIATPKDSTPKPKLVEAPVTTKPDPSGTSSPGGDPMVPVADEDSVPPDGSGTSGPGGSPMVPVADQDSVKPDPSGTTAPGGSDSPA